MDLVALLPLLVILGAFMFFASRRQKKAMQATIDLHNSLKVGDRVHTTSGLQAEIKAINDDDVQLEIAPGIVTTWMKLAVRDRIVEDDEFDDDIDDAGEPAIDRNRDHRPAGPEPPELTTDSRALSTATYPLRC